MRTVIGMFLQDEQGLLHGRIYGLGLGSTVVIGEPVENKKEGQPDFRFKADPMKDAYEIGAGWEKKKDDLTYYSVTIESPLFPAPLHAALFRDKDNDQKFNLIFDRYQQTPRISAESSLHSRRYMGADATL